MDWSPYQRPRGIVQILTVEQYYEVERRIEELNEIIEETIFHLEIDSYGVFAFYVDSFDHPELERHAKERLELEWIRGLVAPDLALVYREVFEWFAKRGDTLASLHWRELEELIAASFEAQGMRTELGPGRADGGIDIRLTQHEVFGDLLTAVQVKGGRTPIKLHYVQALAAASLEAGNDEAIFVTASRYLPSAKRWAESWGRTMRHRLTLATPDDVERWCAAARDRVRFPDRALSDPHPRGSGPLVGRILIASAGWRLVTYRYGLVLRQTPSAVLMRLLKTEVVEGDIQRGYERPIRPTDSPPEKPPELLAARCPENDDRDYLIGADGNHYSPWDGNPVYFDTMD